MGLRLLRTKSLRTKSLGRAMICGVMLAISSSVSIDQVKAIQIEMPSRVSNPPEMPNAILHVDVARLHAVTDGQLGDSALAKNSKTLDVVALVDQHSFEPSWEFGEVVMSDVPSLDDVAKAEGGYLDKVAGTDVAWLPRETFVLPAGNDGLIVVRPADRQLLSRWLSATNRREPLSGYLLEAASKASSDAAVFVAMDGEGAISQVAVRRRLESFAPLAGDSGAMDEVAALLAGVRGLRLEISGTKPATASFAIDFEASPAALRLVARPMLAEALERRDMAIENFDVWTAKVEGNSLVFEGPAAESMIEGVISIFTVPQRSRGVESSVDVAQQVEQDGANAVAAATKVYFDAVKGTVEKVRRYSAQTTGSRAAWNDKMARQIDELSTLNVDPELIDWGLGTADLLRSSGSVIRNANIAAGAEKARSRVEDNVYVQGGYGTGFYGGTNRYGYGAGYYNPNSTDTYDRAVDAQARAQGMSNYRDSLLKIDAATAEMRRIMTERYQIQF